MVFGEGFVVPLIFNIKITIELLNYNVIVKLKVIKPVKLVINNLKFTSVVARAIVVRNN
jgi:hypothetical protein